MCKMFGVALVLALVASCASPAYVNIRGRSMSGGLSEHVRSAQREPGKCYAPGVLATTSKENQSGSGKPTSIATRAPGGTSLANTRALTTARSSPARNGPVAGQSPAVQVLSNKEHGGSGNPVVNPCCKPGGEPPTAAARNQQLLTHQPSTQQLPIQQLPTRE